MPEIGTSGSMSGDGKRSVAEWPKLPRHPRLYHLDRGRIGPGENWVCIIGLRPCSSPRVLAFSGWLGYTPVIADEHPQKDPP